MKKYLFLLALAVLALTACVDDIVDENLLADGKYTLTVNASKGPMSKALDLTESTLSASWTAGDKVKVYMGDTEIGELTAQSTGTSTKLTGDLTATPSGELTLKYLSPNYSSQTGTLAHIAANCDYATATVHVKSVSGKNVTLNESSASFNNQQAIVKFTLLKKADDSDLEIPAASVLTINDGTNNYNVTPASANNVLYVAIPATSTVNLSTTVGGISYSYNKTGASLVAGKYYEISVKMVRGTVDLAYVTGNTTLLNGDVVTGTLGGNYKISIANGATVTLSDATINGVKNSSYEWAGLNCLGDATIVLTDGTINTVKGFDDDYPGVHIPNGYTLTIQGTGTLNASSNGYGAGIGAGWDVNCGNIVIKNGTINASGGSYAAGIGGGYEKSCGTIEIQGGHVTATSSNSSAGIGGGYNAPWGNISISGGTVIATGSSDGAGIGAGSISSPEPNTSCGNISISGGTVTAHGGTDAAGIGTGGGQEAMANYCGTITISGGTVEATGGNWGAGIGTGDIGICGDILIQGEQITANGGNWAAGIGTGHGNEAKGHWTFIWNPEFEMEEPDEWIEETPANPSSCGTITISGGTVDATGGGWSAGIGTGHVGNCGDITITTGITRVTATKGDDSAESSIGTGYNGDHFIQNTYTITIGGTLYWDGWDYQNGGYSYLRQSTLDYQP